MKIQITLSILLAIALVGGCTSPNVVQSGADLGSFRGKVTLLGVDGNPLLQQSDAAVQIEGTTFSTITDSTGTWGIDNVPAGIYDIIISKNGFDTTLYPSYHFSGAGTAFIEDPTLEILPRDSVFFLASQPSMTLKDTMGNIDSNFHGNLLALTGIIHGSDTPQFILLVGKDSIRAHMEAIAGTSAFGWGPLPLSINQSFSDTVNLNYIPIGTWPSRGDTLYVRIEGFSKGFASSGMAHYLHKPSSAYSELHSYIVK
ncbi:MAG TPA: hypothetical protein VFH95_07290 [Candidatus Kapabacteria bacterium]|nr:hypothetical protein [Candidatus Kapabacteria bacterium]